MLTFHGKKSGEFCDGYSRREFLKVGALAVGGLTLADLLRLKAQGAVNAGSPNKAIIMVYLNGGPSHIDLYDLKPNAPVEYRGEFKPIKTNVPGMDICELMPLQAKIADKFAIIRNMKFQQQGHTPPELFTGFLRGNRPSIGSVVSKLRAESNVHGALPPYVYLGDANYVGGPGFLGKAHEAYIPGQKAANLGLARDMTLDRLSNRRHLLRSFDALRNDLDDARGSMAGMDAFTAQAMEMIATNKARDAFDISKEPESVRAKYGTGTEFLQARRLVEAGVPVVTLTPRNRKPGTKCNGEWDHHDHIFRCLRAVVPQLDQSIHALITDLHERGLANEVAVVVWGEMGRTPRVGTQRGTTAGRDHWPASGFALMAGGGLQTGQVVGATDPHGERPKGQPYTPQNVLATLYHVLGIDPVTTLPDHTGRPIYLLDDRQKITELV
ncbi:MAG TPA: DUF1501 domain-containing protein [Gemmataceae bacterium]|nr:DUF1501 domain-containing protein [Gemmataceae bacterium]